jgi:AraC family transcriptional activator of pobA
MSTLPVYAIRDYRNDSGNRVFYANTFRRHLQYHDFTDTPHKHDFYLVVFFTSGTGTHEIDFRRYEIRPGALFLLRPGQVHHWDPSDNTDGFVFFHTREFYDEGFTSEHLNDFPFYSYSGTALQLSPRTRHYRTIRGLMAEICDEYPREEKLKPQKLRALVNLVYIETVRLSPPVTVSEKENYLSKLRKFETLVDQHFKTFKSARDYAGMMNISEKHLNRITQVCLQKTSSAVIAARIILEAKRMLMLSRLNVNQVGDALGYKDKSYFTRFFKKQTGETPLAFLRNYPG